MKNKQVDLLIQKILKYIETEEIDLKKLHYIEKKFLLYLSKLIKINLKYFKKHLDVDLFKFDLKIALYNHYFLKKYTKDNFVAEWTSDDMLYFVLSKHGVYCKFMTKEF